MDHTVAGFSSRRHGFDTRPVRVGYVVNKVALGQVFVWILRFPLISIIPPMLRRNTDVLRRTSRPSLGTFIHGSVVSIIVYRWTEKCAHIVLSLKMLPSAESLFQRYVLSPVIVRSVWLQYNIHDTLTNSLAFTILTTHS